MTTPTAMVEVVSDYVVTQWNAVSFSLPVPGSATPDTTTPPLHLGNEPAAPPVYGTTFAIAKVVHGNSKQRTFGPTGTAKFEHAAKLQMNLFAPAGEGGASALAQLVEIVRGFVERVRLSGLNPFRAGQVTRQFTDGRLSFAIVEFPFTYTERK